MEDGYQTIVQTLGIKHSKVALYASNVGMLKALQGKVPEAKELLSMAQQILGETVGETVASQQSSVASNPSLVLSQLSTPQTRLPLQSESTSQSPSPSPHSESGEQQESSPRHAGDGVVDVSRSSVVEAPVPVKVGC